VPRSAVSSYYRETDLFLFPTFSDGFGLTQLEAQSWKLPLMVSRFCGEVVEDGVNGWVIEPLSGEAIAGCVRNLLEDPSEMQRKSDATSLGVDHRFEGFAARLTGATSGQKPCWNL
jgi:glycosyltransferase involved in cell wall biosynthesis